MYAIDMKKRFSLVFYEGAVPHHVDGNFFTKENGYTDDMRQRIDAMAIHDFTRVHGATTLFREHDAISDNSITLTFNDLQRDVVINAMIAIRQDQYVMDTIQCRMAMDPMLLDDDCVDGILRLLDVVTV